MDTLAPTRLAALGRKLYEERFKDAFASEAAAQGMPLARYVESLLTSAFEEEELREGLADIAAGRTHPAREVFAEFHEQYGT